MTGEPILTKSTVSCFVKGQELNFTWKDWPYGKLNGFGLFNIGSGPIAPFGVSNRVWAYF